MASSGGGVTASSHHIIGFTDPPADMTASGVFCSDNKKAMNIRPHLHNSDSSSNREGDCLESRQPNEDRMD
jgi:hypothetical protein